MLQQASPETPLWSIGPFPTLIQIDGRKVRAGGRVEIKCSAHLNQVVPVKADDMDEFCRRWLEFRGKS